MATLASATVQPRASAKLTLTTPAALTVLALATVLLRIGSWGIEQLDWDEWSFILMGADVAHGHLPFVHQFDLKPPLVFFLFGATIALFGKSLLAIRLLGAVCVFATASFTYLTTRRLTAPWPALAGALLFCALADAPFGLPTSSELPAIAFLSAAMWRLTAARLRERDAAIAGVLVALAVLTRTNLALVALALGALLLVAGLLPRTRTARWGWLAFAVAGVVPPMLLAAAYAATGELATLKLAMIDVPLAYSGQLGAIQVAREHGTQLYYTAAAAPLLYGPAALLTLAGIALALIDLRRRGSDREHTWTLMVAIAIAGAVVASLLIGGAAYPHYWLQLLPFAGLFSAIAVGRMRASLGTLGLGLTALPLAIGVATSLSQARASFASPHPSEEAATWIRQVGGAQPQVWALHKHLTLWYLDAPQLSRAGVHPDNLARRVIIDTLAAHGYVGHDEVGRLMALRPRFVITDAGGKGLTWVRADGKPIDAWLAAHYRREARFGDVLVYRRR
jgi:4-amino-4-deoxy-L-arabinose transferase-like glycosyltransferase